MELVCPAGSMPALKAAVDNSADADYLGFRDGTNARNLPGLNFDLDETHRALNYTLLVEKHPYWLSGLRRRFRASAA